MYRHESDNLRDGHCWDVLRFSSKERSEQLALDVRMVAGMHFAPALRCERRHLVPVGDRAGRGRGPFDDDGSARS